MIDQQVACECAIGEVVDLDNLAAQFVANSLMPAGIEGVTIEHHPIGGELGKGFDGLRNVAVRGDLGPIGVRHFWIGREDAAGWWEQDGLFESRARDHPDAVDAQCASDETDFGSVSPQGLGQRQ